MKRCVANPVGILTQHTKGSKKVPATKDPVVLFMLLQKDEESACSSEGMKTAQVDAHIIEGLEFVANFAKSIGRS